MGGNIGDTMKCMEQSLSLLEETGGKIISTSSVYKTAPWGKMDQQSFLNQALLLETRHSADHLMTCILRVEERIGRKREEKFGPRLIDIDILLFNNDAINTHLVTIPHPQLPYRRFALIPLAEIAADIVHPVLQKTIRELLQDTPDKLEVVLHK